MTKIGKQLKAARDAKNMSRAELSAMCGVSQPTIYAIENDSNPNVKLSSIHKIAQALGMTLIINVIRK